ncbi:MAG: endonuclease III [Deltaproteobacteria bacterium]|nr:endonuclease III [Deltaproteobacteria bacterium]
MLEEDIHKAVKILKAEAGKFKTPYVTEVAERKDPFKVLISCILSLRTKDETTALASKRLFTLAGTPGTMARLSQGVIEKAIFPAGFYRIKAGTIKEISKRLVTEFGSRVPDTIEELLTFKGVGRKTANLVVTMGYDKPGICVDTHVHRITNRWGYISTRSPLETEFELRKKLPKKYWMIINDLLVTYGQNVCRPISPFCSRCLLSGICEKKNVGASR